MPEPSGDLTPRAVAALYRVDPRTVAYWEKSGLLESVRTSGGHRRYPRGQFAAVAGAGPLMTAAEVAAKLQVCLNTVYRWDGNGTITSLRTPGGVPRYPERQFTGLPAAGAGVAALWTSPPSRPLTRVATAAAPSGITRCPQRRTPTRLPPSCSPSVVVRAVAWPVPTT